MSMHVEMRCASVCETLITLWVKIHAHDQTLISVLLHEERLPKAIFILVDISRGWPCLQPQRQLAVVRQSKTCKHLSLFETRNATP